MAPARRGAARRSDGARLLHATDEAPGIRRRRAGRGFVYLRPDGSRLRSAADLARIRSLAIPPAWTDVWISPSPRNHLQATGRDARGRKQYRYHPRWQAGRDRTKYDRLAAFGAALPRLRARVERDLRRTGLPREKVLAAVVRLLDETLIRVGNEEYARDNGSYGLTTLEDDHVDIRGAKLRFAFPGKSGRAHETSLEDPRLARVVRACRDLPGQVLFQYVDGDGVAETIDSADVNEYIRTAAGDGFTAKDFRTWHGTVAALDALRSRERPASGAAAKREVAAAVREVAERLHNTPAVCRRSYIHPEILEAWLDRRLDRCESARARRGLSREECRVLALLEGLTSRAARRPARTRGSRPRGAAAGSRPSSGRAARRRSTRR